MEPRLLSVTLEGWSHPQRGRYETLKQRGNMKNAGALLGITKTKSSGRRRARRSPFRAPRWLVVLVVLAVGSSYLAIANAPASANEDPVEQTITGQCTTNQYSSQRQAQDSFIRDCGQPFQDGSPGFSCRTLRGGTECTGPLFLLPPGEITDGAPAGSAREALGTFPGLTGEERAERFFANNPLLEELIDALPEQPDDPDQIEEIEILAFEQAKLLLNIQPDERSDLWGLWNDVRFGLNPNFHADGVPIFTDFQESFNAASRTQRLEYYGFDEFGWDLAEPFIELSRDMDRIQDDLEDWTGPLIQLFAVAVLGIITSGLAAHAYAAAFGVSVTGPGAVAFGAIVSSYGTTLFTTGSTADAEKAALFTALTAGVTQLTDIPLVSRPNYVKFSIALLEGGIASLDDGDFQQAFLLSLSEQYVPGIGSFIAQLESTSPFLRDLGVELVGLYIEHEGDWDLIADGLGDHVLGEAGELVEGFVGDLLPPEWGRFGEELGELAGIAVSSGGSREEIAEAVGTRLGELAGLGVGNVLGNDESIVVSITEELTSIYVASRGIDREERAAFIDDRLTEYIFDIAGEEISSFAYNVLTNANGGVPNDFIDSVVGFIELAVSNLHRDDLETLLTNYVTQELRGVVNSHFPECGPEWLQELSNQVVAVTIAAAGSGNGGNIGSDVSKVITQAAQTGQIEGSNLGTCQQQADESTPDLTSDQNANGACVIVLASSTQQTATDSSCPEGNDSSNNNGVPEAFGGTVSGVNSSLSVSRVDNREGMTGFQVDFDASAGFARTGTIDIGGQIVHISDLIPREGGGTTNTTVNGLQLSVTYNRELGDVSGNIGGAVSVQVTNGEFEDEFSSGSSQQTDVNVGGLVNVTIPGANFEGQGGIGFTTQVSRTVTQDPDNPNLVTIADTTSTVFGINTSFTLQWNPVFGIGGSDDSGSAGVSAGGTFDGSAPITGTTITETITGDVTTGETSEQTVTFQEEGVFADDTPIGIHIDSSTNLISVVTEDEDGNRIERTLIPEPEVHPLRVVPECVDSDGDGYGWDGTQTCEPDPPPVLFPNGACVDLDGDGWGFNGVETCRI